MVRDAIAPTTLLLALLTASAAAQDPAGLASPPASRGVIAEAALTTMPRGGEDVRAAMFLGTWALTDEQNDLFNITLFEGGAARSNWVKGSRGAEGESGRWSLFGNGVRIDYDDGWIDVVRLGAQGFEQASYSPETSISGPWTNGGKAVRVEGDLAEFTGVFRLVNVDDGKPFAVSLQSNGQAFKTINDEKRGLWRIRDGAAEIEWLNGWVDVIRRVEGGFEKLAWHPGQPRSEVPAASRDVVRMQDAPLQGSRDASRSRAAMQIDPSAFTGVWALTDGQNNTFDVVLFPGGAARSTWSKGPEGSRGEWGRWKPYGNGVRVDYENGWIDLIRYAALGFEEVAFSPNTPFAGPPSATGKATRIDEDLARFIGVFELRMEQNNQPFCVAIQSDGLAFKNIEGAPPQGTWTIDGDSALIRWSDGWIDEFTPLPNGLVAQKTWHPGITMQDPPSAERTGRRLRDGVPGPLRPAAPPPPRE